MPSTDFSPWLNLLNINGDQQNPAAMAQMQQQAAMGGIGNDDQSGVPPALSPNRPSPQQPAVVPLPPQRVPLTATPTTQPIGTAPQEIAPSQPSTMGYHGAPVGQVNPMDVYNKIEALKPTDNSKLMKQLEQGQQSYGESQQLHQDEIDKLKEGLARYASAPQGINFTPLAATFDSLFGSKLTPAAQSLAPESDAKRMETMQEMQQKIAAAQGEIPKEELDSMKNKLAQMGYMDERQNKLDIAKLGAEAKLAGNGFQGARLDLMNQRLNLQTDKEARATVNNDAVLKQFVPRIEGAAKIGELIDSAKTGKVVSNQALLGQVNAEIARLETGSQSPGLGASEKTELQDASAQLGAFRDRITGDPQDAVHPQVLDAAHKLVSELSGSYMRGIDSRMSFLKSGMSPQQQAIAEAKHADIKSTYGPRLGGWHGLNQSDNLESMSDEDLAKLYHGGQ